MRTACDRTADQTSRQARDSLFFLHARARAVGSGRMPRRPARSATPPQRIRPKQVLRQLAEAHASGRAGSKCSFVFAATQHWLECMAVSSASRPVNQQLDINAGRILRHGYAAILIYSFF